MVHRTHPKPGARSVLGQSAPNAPVQRLSSGEDQFVDQGDFQKTLGQLSGLGPGIGPNSLLWAFVTNARRKLVELNLLLQNEDERTKLGFKAKDLRSAQKDVENQIELLQKAVPLIDSESVAQLAIHLASLSAQDRPTDLSKSLDRFKASTLSLLPQDILGKTVSENTNSFDERQRELLDYLLHISGFDFETVRQMLRGANVSISDAGQIYDGFKNDAITTRSLNPYSRISSHESSAPQYASNLGPHMRTILMGKTDEGNTWMQLEGAPWGITQSLSNNVSHILDYLRYKMTGENQGPYGSSAYTDQKRLNLNYLGNPLNPHAKK